MSAVEPRRGAEVPIDRWGRGGPKTLGERVIAAAYDSWFRVGWEGIEHVPTDGGALLVANHAGMMPLDGAIIPLGIEKELGRAVYSLAHHGFWRVPFIGPLLSRVGGVVGHPANAQRLLADDGRLVLVFPEGEKGPVKPPSERYKLQRFGRGGFVETALRAGVPIVPMVLMGTEDATPTVAQIQAFGQRAPITANMLALGPLLGAFAPLPAKITIRVLPPVEPSEPAGRERYSRALLLDVSQRIRGDMQRTLDQMLRDRESILGG